MSKQLIKSLFLRSAKIQREIEKEQKRRIPNWAKLLRLKKLRLVICDRLYSMTSKQRDDNKTLVTE